MEEIIREYGAFLLSGIAILLLLGILFNNIEDAEGNKGIFAMTGAKLETVDIDYKSYNDFKNTYQIESAKPIPDITYNGGHLWTGIIKLTDCIKAEDYAGRTLSVKILEILNPKGIELIDNYNTTTSEIYLEEAGIYTITVSAVDDINKSSKCIIQIPVNK